jgi:hypothetical protein
MPDGYAPVVERGLGVVLPGVMGLDGDYWNVTSGKRAPKPTQMLNLLAHHNPDYDENDENDENGEVNPMRWRRRRRRHHHHRRKKKLPYVVVWPLSAGTCSC